MHQLSHMVKLVLEKLIQCKDFSIILNTLKKELFQDECNKFLNLFKINLIKIPLLW